MCSQFAYSRVHTETHVHIFVCERVLRCKIICVQNAFTFFVEHTFTIPKLHLKVSRLSLFELKSVVCCVPCMRACKRACVRKYPHASESKREREGKRERINGFSHIVLNQFSSIILTLHSILVIVFETGSLCQIIFLEFIFCLLSANNIGEIKKIY